MVDREKFDQRLLQLSANVMECDSQHALCYIDLDTCRFVNDIGGDEARDSLWRLLAERIAASVRPYDTVAWLGDAQIGILLEHCPINDALRIATGLRKQIMISRFERQGKRVTIDTSIGLSLITQAQQNVASALGLAITACYAAKDQGRNKIRIMTNSFPSNRRKCAGHRESAALWMRNVLRFFINQLYP